MRFIRVQTEELDSARGASKTKARFREKLEGQAKIRMIIEKQKVDRIEMQKQLRAQLKENEGHKGVAHTIKPPGSTLLHADDDLFKAKPKDLDSFERIYQ